MGIILQQKLEEKNNRILFEFSYAKSFQEKAQEQNSWFCEDKVV